MHRRPLALHLVPAGVALCVAAATAAPATADQVRPIRQALQPTAATSVVSSAAGDGHVVWAVQGGGTVTDDGPATTALWTLRDGVPVQAATIRDGRPVVGLELGTDVAGVPVAYVVTWGERTGAARRLVRLDTGEARRVPARRGRHRIAGMAIDHGRLLSTENTRGGASLWRARLSGLRSGPPARVRTYRGPEAWGSVAADRNRVAVRTGRSVREEGQDLWLEGFAFGTPRGRWARGGYQYIGDGPSDAVAVAGFTLDRSAVVLVVASDGTDQTAWRIPLSGHGPQRRAHLWNRDFVTSAPTFDAATGRFFGNGPTTKDQDGEGPSAVGWTTAVFPPG